MFQPEMEKVPDRLKQAGINKRGYYVANWVIKNKRADIAEISRELGISQLLVRIMANRGLETIESMRNHLYSGRESMHDPLLMKDMGLAVDLLKKALQEQVKIRIVGDYDVDGICASYILQAGLQLAAKQQYARRKNIQKSDTSTDPANQSQKIINNAQSTDRECDIYSSLIPKDLITVRLPERMTDGYGLNERIVREAVADGCGLLITCDNGIAAAPEIALAKELGMTVIVTDHHEVPFQKDDEGKEQEVLPSAADAIVDPKQTADTYPFKKICGAVVAYKLIQVLIRDEAGHNEGALLMEQLLEPAALATVCDVMDLLDENRIFVKEGLKSMRKPKNLGLRKLCEVNGILGKDPSVYQFGFVLGPCLNSSGRIDHPTKGLELLSCTKEAEAKERAEELKRLNETRKQMTQEGEDAGMEDVERQTRENGGVLPKVLVVFLPDCHESIAGIVAGRLRETYNRPTLVITRSAEGAKGSGRSVEAYNMFRGLTACKDLLTKFGGHPMAAGFSLMEENIPILRQRLNDDCDLTEEDFTEKIILDGAVPLNQVTIDLVRELQLLAPYGNGNDDPVLGLRNASVLSCRVLGEAKNFYKYKITDGSGTVLELITFGHKFHDFLQEQYGSFANRLYDWRESRDIRAGEFVVERLAYSPEINEYNGNVSIQLRLRNFE